MRTPFVAFIALGCGSTAPPPDRRYDVEVTYVRTTDDCVASDDDHRFSKSYTYQIFYEGSATEIKIADESFATGITSGCDFDYQSAVWLEERNAGDIRWQISGVAEYQGAAGGCDLDDGLDWMGSETLEVVESENVAVPQGCTYEMEVKGTFKG